MPTGRHRGLARAAAVTFLLAAVVVAAGPTPAQAAPVPRQESGATLVLVEQTPVSEPGDTVEFRLRITGAPTEAFVQVDVHGRITSRSEFLQTVQDQGLPTRLASLSPLRTRELPRDPSGAYRVRYAIDPEVPGGIPVSAAGVYPVRIRVTDASSSTLATLVTHMVVADPTDESPPLVVSVLADLRTPTLTAPDGTAALDDRWMDKSSELLDALLDRSDVPVTYALTPESIEALVADGSGRSEDLVDQMRRAAARGVLLDVPYTDISAQSLLDADLGSELDAHLDRARDVFARVLDAEPTPTVWLADPDLGPTAANGLLDRAFLHLVLQRSQVSELPPANLSLADRFQVAHSDDDPASTTTTTTTSTTVPGTPVATQVGTTGLDGFEVDPTLTAPLSGTGPAAALGQRLLAEMAVVWHEQPARERGVVLLVDRSTRTDVLGVVLDGLAAGGVLEPVPIGELYGRTDQVTDPSGAPIIRELRAEPAEEIPFEITARLFDVRRQLAGYESTVGEDSPRSLPLQTQVLLATAAGLDLDERNAHLDEVEREVERVVAGVKLPEQPQVTLTARDATIPLTIENDTGHPIDVVVHLESTKLEFPKGDRMPLELDEGTTRLDLEVRALATGAFPLDVRITSPDDQLELTETRYRVRSTAVSGVGLVISVGAGVFLLAWWISHWRRARRSRRLVPLPEDARPHVG